MLTSTVVKRGFLCPKKGDVGRDDLEKMGFLFAQRKQIEANVLRETIRRAFPIATTVKEYGLVPMVLWLRLILMLQKNEDCLRMVDLLLEMRILMILRSKIVRLIETTMRAYCCMITIKVPSTWGCTII